MSSDVVTMVLFITCVMLLLLHQTAGTQPWTLKHEFRASALAVAGTFVIVWGNVFCCYGTHQPAYAFWFGFALTALGNISFFYSLICLRLPAVYTTAACTAAGFLSSVLYTITYLLPMLNLKHLYSIVVCCRLASFRLFILVEAHWLQLAAATP